MTLHVSTEAGINQLVDAARRDAQREAELRRWAQAKLGRTWRRRLVTGVIPGTLGDPDREAECLYLAIRDLELAEQSNRISEVDPRQMGLPW